MLLLCFMLPQADALSDSSVRVWLKRLKVTDVLRIRVQGDYMLEGGSMTFADGTEMTVALRSGKLVLHTQGVAIVMGDSMKLLRSEGEKSGALYLQDTAGAYEGDLSLDITDDVIRPILSIHIEDYLLGVVPYEMGDSFPLEALKAQAIAARTYAMNKQGAARAYDVEDTTNDQAYKGRSANSPLSEQAVRETQGLYGTYQGRLAQCYYSASNGGQTELAQHVWSTDNPSQFGYMDMRDDPYDYENEASSVKRFTLRKKPGEKSVGTALHGALVSALSPQLTARGLAAESDLVHFDEILSLNLRAPKFDTPSRLMTEMVFEVKISVRESLYRDPGVQSASADGTPSADTTPVPTATPAYSPYQPVDEVLTVVLPIFPDAEKAMGLSINVYQNELISVVDIGSAYMIESRRYGHGVGMSQRGAQQMAGKYGMTVDEILAFYYPGMEVKSYVAAREPLPTIDVGMMATPAPTPSPTPRPTLMPVTSSDLPSGAYVATVSNIDEDSSLNLREGPSLSSEIRRRLYKEQMLIVLSVGQDGWAHVKTDVIEGYVKIEYLQAVQEE